MGEEVAVRTTEAAVTPPLDEQFYDEQIHDDRAQAWYRLETRRLAAFCGLTRAAALLTGGRDVDEAIKGQPPSDSAVREAEQILQAVRHGVEQITGVEGRLPPSAGRSS